MAKVECTYCRKEQDSTFGFYWSKGNRTSLCKTCQKRYARSWYQMHLDKIEMNRKAGKHG